MEIVVVTGALAMAALMLLTLRARARKSRGSVRTARSARQWSGSAGSRRARSARSATVAAAAPGGAVAYTSMSAGGGVAVQDPPQTREADLDEWDDDIGWSDAPRDSEPEPVAAEAVTAPLEEAPAAPVGEPGPEPAPAPVAPYS